MALIHSAGNDLMAGRLHQDAEILHGGISSGHWGIKSDGFQGLASDFALFVGTGQNTEHGTHNS